MRTTVVALGLSLVIPAAMAAQSSSPLVVTAATPFRPRLDFGLDTSMKKLEGPWRLVTAAPKHQLPFEPPLQIDTPPAIDCAMVKKHTHGPLAMKVIPPPKGVEHQLKTLPVTPCPVR